ncbi:Cytochrome c oxidase subunit 5B [Desmophyllum pertusum]|uniref:Cytochrome c oxidase subunit 5B n=1 Tax=Desmophyllum pertusum TaxID=174260 RepID=A0A9W9Z1Y0_9CNID|nr:Cytochrome c oxidase subunit 5B [Desmophyllum pertusum]
MLFYIYLVIFQAEDMMVGIPTDAEQLTGKEKKEYDALAAGIEDPFCRKPYEGLPGTKDKPLEVMSMYNERIIGCVCEPDATLIVWRKLQLNEETRCRLWSLLQLVQRQSQCFYAGKTYFQGPQCHSTKSLKGKLLLSRAEIPASAKRTAVDLATRGARVVIGCRNLVKGKAAVKEYKSEVEAHTSSSKKLDLASLDSVRKFRRKHPEQRAPARHPHQQRWRDGLSLSED